MSATPTALLVAVCVLGAGACSPEREPLPERRPREVIRLRKSESPIRMPTESEYYGDYVDAVSSGKPDRIVHAVDDLLDFLGMEDRREDALEIALDAAGRAPEQALAGLTIRISRVHAEMGDAASAERVLREGIDRSRALHGKITEAEFDLAVELGDLQVQQERLDEAERLFVDLLALPELGPESTDTVLGELIVLEATRRNFAKAGDYCVRQFELAQDPPTVSSLRHITETCADLLDRAGQRERADAIWERARVRLKQLHAGPEAIVYHRTMPLP